MSRRRSGPLGVRHVVQAAVTLAKPQSTRWMWTIDAAHGVSMLGLAAAAPRWRTFALTSAAGATTWAIAARTAR
ncbi:hypothetical protein [Amycolatopsis sp. RTGN1]|uniref:hypothetical protein n=1 Tax=Amycolatopsis ponsaeliensis TaxID=2992142 RepID=UPI00254E9485|nr:hypothetical protein [Amycolatopsis sp. RTGN1]